MISTCGHSKLDYEISFDCGSLDREDVFRICSNCEKTKKEFSKFRLNVKRLGDSN